MRPGYEPMRARERAVVLALAAVVAIDVVAIGSTLAELRMLDRIDAGEPVPDSEIDASNARQSAVGLVQTALVIAAAVFFIRWLRLAYRNTDVLAPALRRFKHGWAIGAWFVPILNLWRPKQIVNDVWRAGGEPGDPHQPELPALLNIWWAGWVLTNVLGQVAGRLALRQDTNEELRTVDAWYIASDAVDGVVAVLAILVVRRISARLEERGASAPPPPAAWQPPAAPEGVGSGWSADAPERPGS